MNKIILTVKKFKTGEKTSGPDHAGSAGSPECEAGLQRIMGNKPKLKVSYD